uniref:Uncharacterized protein n=1 Tax=Arundo donax TaxID=35708 RepID=A0A0A9EHB0_ARUDO
MKSDMAMKAGDKMAASQGGYQKWQLEDAKRNKRKPEMAKQNGRICRGCSYL